MYTTVSNLLLSRTSSSGIIPTLIYKQPHHAASRSITQHHAASRSITQHHAASRSTLCITIQHAALFKPHSNHIKSNNQDVYYIKSHFQDSIWPQDETLFSPLRHGLLFYIHPFQSKETHILIHECRTLQLVHYLHASHHLPSHPRVVHYGAVRYVTQ